MAEDRPLQRWTGWAGGPWVLLVLILVEVMIAGFTVIDPQVSIGLLLAGVAAVAVLERPIVGVGVLIASRLLSTGATVFFRIGSLGIGPYEPVLVLCVTVLVLHAVFYRRPLLRSWPWAAPFLALMGWMCLSLAWSHNRAEGLGEILPLVLVLANALVILCFVDRWSHFEGMIGAWIGTSVLVGVLAMTTDAMSIGSALPFEAAARGGRETGLGQQPNWFAMNLMFIVPTTFGLAMTKRGALRFALIVAGVFIFFMMLKSGSRGAAYAVAIGAVLTALFQPAFRRWFLRLSLGAGVVFGMGLLFDLGGSGAALRRIASNLTLQQNYRVQNWWACLEMLRDTWGRGIGAGGYTTVLPRYNAKLAASLYDYPHGIFWEFVAHYGVIGLMLLGWLLWRIARMVLDTHRSTQNQAASVFAWTMPATMVGYFAWSFVEFTYADKPFWEFLALYTALSMIVRSKP